MTLVTNNENTFKVHRGGGGTGTTNLYMHIPSGVTSQATAETWLSENPMTIYYPLAIPKVFDITTEQIEALQNLRSYNNITNIFTTDECQPEIETSLYTSLNIE